MIMRMNNEKGFSLIETLVGLGVFGIIGVFILTCLAMNSRANISNANLTQAESLARNQLEYIQSQTYHATDNGTSSPLPYSAIGVPSGYSLNSQAQRVNASGSPVTTDDGLQKITISVNYNSDTLFTIVDYKINK
jgi:prepilin-type N-terminal cleavage/methylation domain-containing protein